VKVSVCEGWQIPLHITEEVNMYMLIRSLPFRQLLLEQVPTLGTALIIAELFYKFHSFTLECIAFLATWYMLDAAVQFLPSIRGTAPGRKS
jgi:hypothetical protein